MCRLRSGVFSVVNRIVVTGKWLEPREGGFELAGVDRCILEDWIYFIDGWVFSSDDLFCRHFRGKAVEGGSKNDPWLHLGAGTPDETHGVIRCQLNVGLPGEFFDDGGRNEKRA